MEDYSSDPVTISIVPAARLSAAERAAVKAVQDSDIAALSPSDARCYTRLGWTLWQGTLFERTDKGIVASPEDEEVMIYHLPDTPELSLDRPLSIEWRELEVW